MQGFTFYFSVVSYISAIVNNKGNNQTCVELYISALSY